MPETRKKKKRERARTEPPESEPVSKPGRSRDQERAISGTRLPAWLAPLLLAALVGWAYSNSFGGGWHLDDISNITQNPYVQITSLSPASLFRAMIHNCDRVGPSAAMKAMNVAPPEQLLQAIRLGNVKYLERSVGEKTAQQIVLGLSKYAANEAAKELV